MGVSELTSCEGTVLVADDEPSVLKLAQRTLERKGFQVLTATRGDMALDLFKANRQDIVLAIVDFSMPGIDGAELIEHFHEAQPNLSVVLTSGLDLAWFPAELITKPNVEFIQKPFRINSLLLCLEELMACQASSPKKNFNNLVVRSIS